MMDSQQIINLIKKFLAKKLNEAESKELDQWISESVYNRQLFERVTDGKLLFEAAKESIIVDQKIASRIREKHPELALLSTGNILMPMRKHSWAKAMQAAAMVVVVASAGYVGYRWLSNPDKKKAPVTAQVVTADRKPGKEGAVLKLANGEEIVLDDAANGNLTIQGSTQVSKQGGLLAYNNTGSNKEVLYNTLSTPRGRHFQVTLPDGSHVWLNAASSIRFPTAFTGNGREVTITGEAYLEVKKDAAKPFKVLANGTAIEVLGTHFNVNAYSEEATVKTTLVEGKVKVISGRLVALLSPGQQAQAKAEKINVVEKADMNAALGWKNGLIIFSAADIRDVLRQVSRWYDVDVEYKSDVKVPAFYGEIPRTVNLSDVLKIIELNSQLRFTVTGNKVIVTQPA